jgi:hypothetical protein
MTPLPNQTSFLEDPPKFGGVTFDPARDGERLSGALGRVYSLMLDGEWRTIADIAAHCGCSEAGASARLRDLRKEKFREHYPNLEVQRKNCGGGLWMYRMI